MAEKREDVAASLETWDVDDGTRAWVGGNNPGAKLEVENLLGGVERPPTGPIDLAVITPQSVDEGLYFAGKLRARMTPVGRVWIVYPKSFAPQAAEFTGSVDDLVLGMFEQGYVALGTAAIGEWYTSNGFRIDRHVQAMVETF